MTNKTPVRRCERVFLKIQLKDLVPNHRCAEETQHLADRIRDRRATTAGEKKTNRARIRRDILHHQRPGVAAVEEFAPSVCNNDLAGECLGEGSASRALVIVGDADRRVQTRDRTSGQPSRATALFDFLIKGGVNGGGGDGADLKNRAMVCTWPVMTFATEQSTLLPGSELFFTNVATVCAPAEEQLTSIKPG